MKLVVIESPYAADPDADEYTKTKQVIENVDYARRCMLDSLMRGEAPYASHLLFTQPGILDDGNPTERKLGIAAGLAWGDKADLTAVYMDKGVTSGMKQGIERANKAGRNVVYRWLDNKA